MKRFTPQTTTTTAFVEPSAVRRQCTARHNRGMGTTSSSRCRSITTTSTSSDSSSSASFLIPRQRSFGMFPAVLGRSSAGVVLRVAPETIGEQAMQVQVQQPPQVQVQAAPSGVYEAVLPPTETLAGMGFIVVLCVALYWVWEQQVVPVSRTKLAISKSRGEVKEYLDELRATSASGSTVEVEVSVETDPSEATAAAAALTTATTTVATDSSLGVDESAADVVPSASTNNSNNRAFERWLFTDWLSDNKSDPRKAGRQKEPALPVLKNAKWNSGDNPVVVAALLMLIGLVATAATERIAGVLG